MLARLLAYGAAFHLWGAQAYLAWLVPTPLRLQLAKRLSPFTRSAAIVALAAILAQLPLRGAVLGEDWSAAISPSILSALLWQTPLGAAWAAQVLTALIVATAACARPAGSKALALAGALLLAGFTLSGHAAMQGSGAAGIAQRANDGLHLLAAGAWTGALMPVLLLLPQLKIADKRAQAQLALMRFSTAGHLAVALAIATCMANAAMTLGAADPDAARVSVLLQPVNGSLYRILLAVKVLVVAFMVGLALVNRYLIVPRLGRRPNADKALALGTAAEIGLAAMVIALVAAFGILDPGNTGSH
ncbi:hypothetical protein BJF93_08950 [Xaviernesmea oryzae]|uniref:Copper resistance protein D domain-containing protein n=2 Tax=Xaviernesmea oryzae TaxID=464029 RepID=A0A1Q9B170_9HYPH|nr:hypothetical protein BJF93_08950 [Xaviernesmea oryzae]SEL01285.1 putative copper resistance protein D [Xaviernesmea oryzae]